MTSTAEGAPARPRVWRADHAGEAFDRDIDAALALVEDSRGPHYLAHSTYGIRDFAVGSPGGWPVPAAEAAFEDVGGALNLIFTQLDRACEPLDSGPLIRLALQGTAGALFEFSKVPGQNFCGIAFGGDPEIARHADRALADLTRESLERLGGTSLDWGGFRDRDSSGNLWIPYQGGSGASSDGSPDTTVSGDAGALPGRVADLCLSALSPEDLHAVGVFRRDQAIWTADLFGAGELSPFFERVSGPLRRRGYARLAHDIRLHYPRFRRLLDITGSARLTRLVLDVARGAMYLLPLADDHYLGGVTLIQSRVDRTDQKLRRLHSDVMAAWPASGTRQLS